jgi:hypothetical protein
LLFGILTHKRNFYLAPSRKMKGNRGEDRLGHLGQSSCPGNINQWFWSSDPRSAKRGKYVNTHTHIITYITEDFMFVIFNKGYQ